MIDVVSIQAMKRIFTRKCPNKTDTPWEVQTTPYTILPEGTSMKGNEKLLETLNSRLSDELTAISRYMGARETFLRAMAS